MKPARIAISAAVVFAALAVACNESPTAADGLYDDAAVTLDVASSAGDAVAKLVETMSLNETAAGGSAEIGSAPAGASDVTVSRSRTCYDANNAVVTNCVPFSSVRAIATSATFTGSRSSTRTNSGGATVTWTGAVHRSSRDSTTRVFTGATETSRVHNDLAVAHDTTTFTDGAFTRLIAESARDTVKSVTFNVPRSSNPFPVSGSIVRVDTVHAEVSKEGRSVSRDVVRVVEVIFPADAQGNVVLKINAKTCQLNLVTHAVTGCSN